MRSELQGGTREWILDRKRVECGTETVETNESIDRGCGGPLDCASGVLFWDGTGNFSEPRMRKTRGQRARALSSNAGATCLDVDTRGCRNRRDGRRALGRRLQFVVAFSHLPCFARRLSETSLQRQLLPTAFQHAPSSLRSNTDAHHIRRLLSASSLFIDHICSRMSSNLEAFEVPKVQEAESSRTKERDQMTVSGVTRSLRMQIDASDVTSAASMDGTRQMRYRNRVGMFLQDMTASLSIGPNPTVQGTWPTKFDC